MVDRQAIEQALSRIGGDTYRDADRGIQDVNGKVMLAGRTASHAHNSMLTTAATEAYQVGLNRMVAQVRDYAGATAAAHVDALSAAADRVLKQLIAAHESRLTALAAGKYPGIKQHHDEFLGSFTMALTAARDAAVSDLKHTLQDRDDALSWWARHSREVKLAAVNAIISAAVSAIVAWIVLSLSAAPGS